MFAYCNNSPIILADSSGKRATYEAVEWVAKKVIKPVLRWCREKTSQIDGTATIGLSFVASPGFWNYNYQIGISFDFKGNIAIQETIVTGVTTGTPSGTAGLYGMVTNAPSVQKLDGKGYQFGGSMNAPSPSGLSAGIGGEFNVIDDGNNYYYGVTGSLSLATTPGTEAHVEWGNTRTIATINIYDIFENTFALLYGG